ncbi:alpha/beta fold hydrolase [Nonomuraea sp. NN258]|uniref:alpha/beta fold hydrolase n=1 Tax=Nonomuraea antri TaxID=2730852 RepID=UPI0015692B49|nr:alpha/beta fold hydrolase [Nonomuraea antri]NRQ30587.1 alpha/beta fold hydrolase [Nonomuraea antri]
MIIRIALALALTAPPVMSSPAPLESRLCPVAVPARTRCGFLVVPERRDAPARTIKVGYTVRVSTAPGRKPDPVVYMSGGPGSASMQLTGFLAAMFPDRDVVTVEQRGSRYSAPVLSCPETAEALLGQVKRPRPDVATAAVRCRARLGEQGVDLRGYTTGEIAADVVALRQALGYASWNLFGVSYSTRVMLDVAAADPAGVRSVVLDSFLPAGVAWYDDAEANLAGTLAGLGAGTGAAFERAVRRLNRAPARLPTTDPLLGTRFTAEVTGDDVAAILAEALHESDVAAVAPALVGALAAGRDAPLAPLVDGVADGLLSHEFGLYHAVQCQDEVPYNRFASRSRLFTINADKAVCDAWKLPKSPLTRSTTKAPALVLGGQHDPTTPPRTSRPAAAALPNARFAEFPAAAHAVFLSDACARAQIAHFLDTPGTTAWTTAGTTAVADGTATGGPCQDVRPARAPDLHVTAAPYLISRAPWQAAPFALFALISLLQFVTGALKGRSLPATAGLAGLACAGLIAQSVHALAASNAVALAVGVPSTVTLYGWLAPVSAALTAASLLQRRRWPQIVATLVSAGFCVWWFTWFL